MEHFFPNRLLHLHIINAMYTWLIHVKWKLLGGKYFYLIVDDDSSIILEIEEGSVFSPKCLPLSYDDSRHDCKKNVYV